MEITIDIKEATWQDISDVGSIMMMYGQLEAEGIRDGKPCMLEVIMFTDTCTYPILKVTQVTDTHVITRVYNDIRRTFYMSVVPKKKGITI